MEKMPGSGMRERRTHERARAGERYKHITMSGACPEKTMSHLGNPFLRRIDTQVRHDLGPQQSSRAKAVLGLGARYVLAGLRGRGQVLPGHGGKERPAFSGYVFPPSMMGSAKPRARASSSIVSFALIGRPMETDVGRRAG